MFNHIPTPESYQIVKTSATTKENGDQDHKSPHTSVTFVYQAKVAEYCRNVTVTWIKNLINYCLCISVENPFDDQNNYTCKIELKTWQFWGKKGLKSFDIDGKRVDVYWDFRQAKFSTNPEPCSDYYVALVYEEEVVLVLGDLKKDAYKRTKRRPSLVEPILLCKKENVCGRKLFCTKALLPNNSNKKEHVIVIEISLSQVGDSEMWISIDGYEVIHVMNLHWRFRGNEGVTINDAPLQIFWDVHDWVFNDGSTAGGHGLFILKPGGLESSSDGGDNTESVAQPEYFHAIYAWKFDQ